MAEMKTMLQKATTVRDLVTKYIPQIAKAVPRGIDAARFARVALTMLPNNPNLLDCDPKSLLGGILQAAAWGLELDPVLGMAYLVPFGKKAQIIIGYQGLIELSRRSGAVKNIIPQSVYEKDLFEYTLGLNPNIIHKPSSDPDRGKLLAVYSVARMSDGTFEFRFMWIHEVDAIRARSRAAQSGPWVTDYEAMAWKTVIRRLCKYLPRTVDLAKAIDMDEKADAGLEQNLEDSFALVIDAEPAEKTSTLDNLAATMKSQEAKTEPAKTESVAKTEDAPLKTAAEMAAGGTGPNPKDPRTNTEEVKARTHAPEGHGDTFLEDELAKRKTKPLLTMPAAADVFASVPAGEKSGKGVTQTEEREPGQDG